MSGKGKDAKANYLFEASWEVCNKVGGIHTVLESLAPTLSDIFGNHVVFIGPDLGSDAEFREDAAALPATWAHALRGAGIACRIGRWLGLAGDVPAILIGVSQLYSEKNDIYARMWRLFGVDSLHAYGDYDDSSMWAYAVGMAVETIAGECLPEHSNVVLQAHEWQSAMALLRVKESAAGRVATVFTTHATTVGRSICDNGKCLYKYFPGYDGDVMARELCVESKHSAEKAAARYADCFTTVSDTTAAECEQLLGKKPDIVLPNGFNMEGIPSPRSLSARRSRVRQKLLGIAAALTGRTFENENTIIIATSGRNDYKPKGYDLYLSAVRRIADAGELSGKNVLALVEVPLWVAAPRADLLQRLTAPDKAEGPMPRPFITHDLNNYPDDRIVSTIRSLGLDSAEGRVHVVLLPVYLGGDDGVLDEQYYDVLAATDMTIYPSYYEPWGYTPMESAAYGVPTVTTSLSGFGRWAMEQGATADIRSGVAVIDRDDDNYDAAAQSIASSVSELAAMSPAARRKAGAAARSICAPADWRSFVENYLAAFSIAIRNSRNLGTDVENEM